MGMVEKEGAKGLRKRVDELEEEVSRLQGVERALRRSQRRLRILLDFLPSALAILQVDGRVYYLNRSFTELFGWTLEELEGGHIPFVPPGLEAEANEILLRLVREKVFLRYETRRLTKDGGMLDVVLRAGFHEESEEEPARLLMTFRDVTQPRRIARINETILRISTALPEYPDLEELLDYIDSEVKELLGTEGSVVILLDEEKQELFVLGAAYDDTATEKRAKEIRFKMNQLVAGEVIEKGEPIIVSDTTQDEALHRARDRRLGYETRNLLLVPLRSSERIIGVLCAINKKEGAFDHTDVELLNTIAGTVALSVENARVTKELRKAYREVKSLNRAKDRVIHHLSHELKTPVSIVIGSLRILVRTLSAALPEKAWKDNVDRIRRNLDRIVDLQYEVTDIMQDHDYRAYDVLSLLLEQCADEIEVLVAEEGGREGIVKRVRERIEEIFGPKEAQPQEIRLHEFVRERLEALKPSFTHREVEVKTCLEPAPALYIPRDPLGKVVDGLVRNAIENTPDEGRIEVVVRKRGPGTELIVRDWGVGIVEEAQRRVFEGFFATQDPIYYSSKRPFDFNAGGKGADLLRMKIFSERYHFKITMSSNRCRTIPAEQDACPGRISDCNFCKNKEDCYASGGTTFTLFFPGVGAHAAGLEGNGNPNGIGA